MWAIKDGIKLIARGGSVYDLDAGAHFLSDPKDMMQYAVFRLPSGEEIQRHIHKNRHREGYHPTNEFFVVLSGGMEVVFFNDRKTVIDRKNVMQGDFFCQHSGGHGFKTLSPNTLFIEVKHGPYEGVEADKIKF